MASDPDFMLSLARGLSVLRAFETSHGPLTVSEAARATGMSRAAARRCLHTLTVLGYAAPTGAGYELTASVLALAHSYLDSNAIARVAQPVLERISSEVRESSSLAMLDGHEIVYVARSATRRILSIGISVGTRLPAACTSMGRVIVAFDDLQEVLDAIEAGIIYATMVQRPVQMGKLSISESFKMLTEEYVPECALLDTGVTVVTLDNIDTYTK